MISIVKIENISNKEDNTYIIAELRGKSTDTKPTEMDGQIIGNGSTYLEIDTGDIYLYDLETEEWTKM